MFPGLMLFLKNSGADKVNVTVSNGGKTSKKFKVMKNHDSFKKVKYLILEFHSDSGQL